MYASPLQYATTSSIFKRENAITVGPDLGENDGPPLGSEDDENDIVDFSDLAGGIQGDGALSLEKRADDFPTLFKRKNQDYVSTSLDTDFGKLNLRFYNKHTCSKTLFPDYRFANGTIANTTLGKMWDDIRQADDQAISDGLSASYGDVMSMVNTTFASIYGETTLSNKGRTILQPGGGGPRDLWYKPGDFTMAMIGFPAVAGVIFATSVGLNAANVTVQDRGLAIGSLPPAIYFLVSA